MSNQDKQYLYKNALAVVVPSSNEAFVIPIWEAYQTGCPVIYNRDPELIEQCGGAGIVFDIDKPQTFGVALNEVINDKNVGIDLIQSGINRLNEIPRMPITHLWIDSIAK